MAAGGGVLEFTANKTYTGVSLSITTSVPPKVRGVAATIVPAANSFAFTLNAGRSQTAKMGVEDVLVVCTGVTGAGGVKIVDHYGAYLRHVSVINPAQGVLITDSTGWSESRQLDDVYVPGASAAAYDFAHNGSGTGTGLFGYANWGLVQADGIPAGSVGFRFGAGGGFSNSTITELVCHSSAIGAIAMQTAGDLGLNTHIYAVLEALVSLPMGKALDIASTGPMDGCAADINFVGQWGTPINNPSARPLQIRATNTTAGQRNFRIAAATNQPIEQSGNLGDANPMYARAADGTLRWGPGGSAGTDVTLQRAGVAFLTLTASPQMSGR